MTTTVKVHVGGNYKATVEKTLSDGTKETVTVEGNTPGNEYTFSLGHPAVASFSITEEALPDKGANAEA